MKLSIVIVNYNVKYFLEQCLHSVRKAIKEIDCEVFVVDNNSVDDSCEMVLEKFPEVILIANKHNKGFSSANNQAIRQSKGEYILLLNPDTLVQEDTFIKTVRFMDSTPDAGGLGVKMIDGNGVFLPESKRGLPTPLTAAYKIFGLSSLFPKSKRFGKYHLGYLDMNENHEVDVLSGAFMLMRKSVLDEVGLLDETFFMYGEDIDLSYRIQLGGYKNYYCSDTTIVHYKGESTKKNSLNYVLVFYNAMEIFFKKHFQSRIIGLFSLGVKFAIYLRAFLAILKRFLTAIAIPAIDATLIWLFFILLLPHWEIHKFGQNGIYPDAYTTIIVPVYILVMLLSILYSGGYDKPYKKLPFIRGILVGFGSIFLFYSLLNENLRFSRAMIIFAMLFASMFLPLLRLIYKKLNVSGYNHILRKKANILLAGNADDAEKTIEIIKGNLDQFNVVGRISDTSNDKEKLGTLDDIADIVRIHRVDEIIFCSTTLTTSEIIDSMMLPELSRISFKIASPDGIAVIGSSSILTNNDLYDIEINSISKPINLRNKRTFDIAFSLILLIFFPITLFANKPFGKLLKNSFKVLIGKRTWVGFTPNTKANPPILRQGILHPAMDKKRTISDKTVEKINRLYAKDYRIINDISIIARHRKHLSQQ
ncbi:MAG: glycosyltransferase [Salinivirgaceae bacterium]|nr:glycosyltransferase [Salinivirgaceae bacterium]